MKKKSTVIIILLLIVDQITKLLVTSNLDLYDSITIIPKFLSITYSRNFGAAFGILEGKIYLFLIMALLVLGYLIYELIKSKSNKLPCISLSLMISGILGNFIDRVVFGYVRDFIDFKIFNYNFPIFNFADSFIVVGVIIYIIYVLMEERNGSK